MLASPESTITHEGVHRAWMERLERLPVLPAGYRELQGALADEACGLEDIARIVSRDPAMTGELLQLANSAAFAPPSPVGTVHDALSVVGVGVLRGLVLAQGLFRDLACPSRGMLSREYLWRHSFSTGMLARTLARRFGSPATVDPETAFTAGLLHDIGKLLLSSAFGERYFQIMVRSVNEQRALHVLEREAFGAGHDDVGAYLFGLWQLPQPLVEAVRWHHCPSIPGETFSGATAVHLASLLEYHHSGPPPFRASTADEHHLAKLGIPHDPVVMRRLLAEGMNAAKT
jgi:putative nucleotidyltransferase with HDIG domain